MGHILCFAVLNMNLHMVSSKADRGQLFAMKATSENEKNIYYSETFSLNFLF